ncbi:MAG TPA: GAF domain-containing sensor histidine kinase, partial [Anaerolineae bacterium]|nr:GAF domain-containing sensor histidine kinase [Anaerolineae bacterium]
LLLIAVVVALGFLFYDPYRRFIERITFRYLGSEGLNSNQIIRNYSQAIARTLDVQQLSVLIAGTLSEMLETNRCALLLVSQQDDGRYKIEPIAGMGQIPREEVIFPAKDRFITLLSTEHQPLLQYDIDFNPVYSDINDAHGDWLNSMAMEGYVPISDGDEIAGIIAVGPKGSGLPYQSNELELMQTLADQTIVALQNARLYSVLNAQNEQVRLLNEDLVDQNEKLEIMDRVKTDFITIASHELRTPLTQVKGYADILAAMNEENALSREQTREIVGHINRATLQLEGLITDMLETSQLDVDEMRLTFVKTRLQSIIKLAMEPLIQALRERRITLTQEGVDELPPIYADYKRLVQAFTKLLGNAVKYTPDGGRITVTAALIPSVDEEEEFFEVIIQDSGIGIDPKFHELIFEKFFRIGDPQLHSTGSTKFKGAGPGLGLPIAKGVIEGHNGRIWVESEGEDEQRMPGSAFHIILPVKPAEVEIEPIPELEERPSYLIG